MRASGSGCGRPGGALWGCHVLASRSVQCPKSLTCLIKGLCRVSKTRKNINVPTEEWTKYFPGIKECSGTECIPTSGWWSLLGVERGQHQTPGCGPRPRLLEDMSGTRQWHLVESWQVCSVWMQSSFMGDPGGVCSARTGGLTGVTARTAAPAHGVLPAVARAPSASRMGTASSSEINSPLMSTGERAGRQSLQAPGISLNSRR